MVQITKTVPEGLPENQLDQRLTGGLDQMQLPDQVGVIQHLYGVATNATPEYDKLRSELNEYNIELPADPDISNLSEINKKYAIAQSNLSRVSNIEINAIANMNNWTVVKSRMLELIAEQTSALLVSEAIRKLSNAALQQAQVRTKLNKQYRLLAKLQQAESIAKAFLEAVASKKKDLSSIIMNLSRQVKVISLENAVTK